MTVLQLNAIIVDDEPLAHEVLKLHLHSLSVSCQSSVSGNSNINGNTSVYSTTNAPMVHIQKHCYSATEALAWLANNTTDLMFLDINMPGLSGLELLKVIANRPQVILISAYAEFAVQGFELDVTDYLLKPVSAERIHTALNKVATRHQTTAITTPVYPESIVVQVDRTHHKIKVQDILWLEAYGNYVKLWLDNDMLLVTSTLKQLLIELQGICIQVHKSYAINVNKVVAVNGDFVTLVAPVQTDVKIGKSYKHEVKGLLHSNK